MVYEIKDFGISSNFNFNTSFNNRPSKPSNYPRGTDGYSLESEIKFYNQESLWTRWRRGYELYVIMQTILGSTSKERDSK